MVNVAQRTHEDSVTLKSLTRVATIYLPATLIAVSVLSRVETRLESLLESSLLTFFIRQSLAPALCGWNLLAAMTESERHIL